jgi:hypothetical protein
MTRRNHDSSMVQTRNRIALIIANGKYTLDHPNLVLEKSVRDGERMAGVLQILGFAVTTLIDATAVQMKQAILIFVNAVGEKPCDSFFMFSGHGIEENGCQYLTSIDFIRPDTGSTQKENCTAISLDILLIQELKKGGHSDTLNILMLDCCREDKDNEVFRMLDCCRDGDDSSDDEQPRCASAKHLPPQFIVAYATAPGTAAMELSSDANGLFTGVFLKVLDDRPEDHFHDIFVETTKQVSLRSGGRQEPWFSAGALRRHFYFDKVKNDAHDNSVGAGGSGAMKKSSGPNMGGRKRLALIIVNSYSAKEGSSWTTYDREADEVLVVTKELVKDWHFEDDDVMLVRNAKKEVMMIAIHRFVAKAKETQPCDTFVFFFGDGGESGGVSYLFPYGYGADKFEHELTNLEVTKSTSGMHWKEAVTVASTANVAGTYNISSKTITADSTGTLDVQDGITLGADQRILLKHQTDASQNGVYAVTTLGDSTSLYILTRAKDSNSTSDLTRAAVFVAQGSVNADTGWTQTVDSTGIVWTKVIGAVDVGRDLLKKLNAPLVRHANALNIVMLDCNRLDYEVPDAAAAGTGAAAAAAGGGGGDGGGGGGGGNGSKGGGTTPSPSAFGVGTTKSAGREVAAVPTFGGGFSSDDEDDSDEKFKNACWTAPGSSQFIISYTTASRTETTPGKVTNAFNTEQRHSTTFLDFLANITTGVLSKGGEKQEVQYSTAGLKRHFYFDSQTNEAQDLVRSTAALPNGLMQSAAPPPQFELSLKGKTNLKRIAGTYMFDAMFEGKPSYYCEKTLVGTNPGNCQMFYEKNKKQWILGTRLGTDIGCKVFACLTDNKDAASPLELDGMQWTQHMEWTKDDKGNGDWTKAKADEKKRKKKTFVIKAT